MNIYYQGEPGAYSNEVSENIKDKLNIKINKISGLSNFSDVWEKIEEGNIGVLPVENSYAGSIHENIYKFLRYDYQIIGEYDLKINHYLLSKEKEIKNINKVYSHPQALNQCHNFLKKNHIIPEKKYDTAGSAKIISTSNEKNVGAIASKLAGKIYNLNIIKDNIADQNGNTTKFFLISKKSNNINYYEKSKKISIIFEAKDIPASLHKCLGVFAINNINLTKIESMPSLKDPFTYMFFISFSGTLKDENIKKTLKKLEFFTKKIKILGEY